MAQPQDLDFDLLQRWRDGDQGAGSKLFARHFKALYRFFRSKVANGVEDLVQDTLLACVRGRDRLRDAASFRAYMFAVARRVLMAHYNKGRRSKVDPMEASVLDLAPGASSIIAKRQDDRLILQALRMLPLDYQIMLELHDWEGLTGPEIAEALEMPEGTVRSRIRRGRIQLRAQLEVLAESPAQLETTLTRLEDWAQAMRELIVLPDTTAAR